MGSPEEDFAQLAERYGVPSSLIGEIAELLQSTSVAAAAQGGSRHRTWFSEDSNHPPSASAPRPGEVSPPQRYQLLSRLGAGGMGEVHEACDLPLNRQVALKVLRADVTGAAAVARFVEEAQLTAQLQHPSIVPIYDLGRLADGRPFFTMREVRGRTLREAIGTVHAASAGRAVAGRRRGVLVPPADGGVSPGLRDGGLCPRSPGDRPRPQAPQHHAGALWRGPGARLGHSQGGRPPGRRRRAPARAPARRAPRAGRRRSRADHVRRGQGHAGLHGARAGARRDSTRWARPPTCSPWGASCSRSCATAPRRFDREAATLRGSLDGRPRPDAALVFPERPPVPEALQTICTRALSPDIADRYPDAGHLAAEIGPGWRGSRARRAPARCWPRPRSCAWRWSGCGARP